MQPKKVMTTITVRELANRVASINANCGAVVTDAMLERMIGVSQTLAFMAGKESYVLAWVQQAEKEIQARHRQIRPTGCGCAVCALTGNGG